MFYKLAGFRFLGKRAVRIDILERLADIIRPLLQWKPGQASRPDGAYDGRRFTTTTAMLSILGATLEDMEEILKGLGYRADAVKPEEASAHLAQQDTSTAPAAAAPDALASDAVAAEAAVEEAIDKAEQDGADHGDAATEEPQPQTDAVVSAEPAPAAAEAPAEAVAEAQAELPGTDVVASEPVEPKPVLLWRLGGRNEGNQRQGQGRGDRRGNGQGQGQERPGYQGRRSDEQGGAGNREGQDNREARGNRDNRGPRGNGNRDGGNRDGANRDGARPPHQGNRPERNDRNERQDRGERKDRNDRNDRNNRGGASQPLRFEAKPPRKEKPIDPDSPFAKLAALKEQMKK
jgi:ATP-dependent RNA helicase SUPV3L1/SUV3